MEQDCCVENLPEVVGAIFVANNNDRNFGVRLDWVDTVRSIGEVLINVGSDTLEGGFAMIVC
jgi:hypothetical protein